jgi:ElaA protein
VPTIHSAPTRNLDVVTLHEILRVRQDVFIVEQDCPYPDIDGRDLELGTVQYWTGDDGVEATVRLLRDPDGNDRIGRVATRASARGKGLAGQLMRAAIADARSGRIDIDAQAYLHDWYAGFGFVRSGDDFLEDGIPHIPMTLTLTR